MSAPELVFHIGRPKTGSSAIQAFLDANRRELARAHGILYPNLETDVFDAGGEAFNHSRIVVHAAIADAVERIAKAHRFAQRAGLRQVVISSESQNPRFVEIAGEVVRRTAAPARVICYLRRQDHLVESAWKQWGIRSSLPDIGAYAERMLQKLERGEPNELDYHRSLLRWSARVGPAALLVRPYEKGQLREGDVVSDFLALVGIPGREGLRAPADTNRNANKGFQPEAMAFLTLCRGSLGSLHDNRMLELFYEAFGEGGRKRPFDSYRLLSPALRLRILEACEPSNRSIAREFCGREDGRLFFEPWPRPDEAWRPVRLSPEEAGSMLLLVLARQARAVDELRSGVAGLHARLGEPAAGAGAAPAVAAGAGGGMTA